MDEGEKALITAQETQSIIYSLAKILELHGGSIHNLPKNDALMLALSGEMLMKMVQVNVDLNTPNEYIPNITKELEESFLEHKEAWINILMANQDKVIGMFAGGMMR
jgi:hypothetical protein